MIGHSVFRVRYSIRPLTFSILTILSDKNGYTDNQQKNLPQNFSNIQIPLPLPSQNFGVVLYCSERWTGQGSDEPEWLATAELENATLAQLVEQLICNQ